MTLQINVTDEQFIFPVPGAASDYAVKRSSYSSMRLLQKFSCVTSQLKAMVQFVTVCKVTLNFAYVHETLNFHK